VVTAYSAASELTDDDLATLGGIAERCGVDFDGVEAAAAGATRVRAKMAAAVELAALAGRADVDAALGVAATAGRFAAEDDLLAIVRHRAAVAPSAELVVADETHSAQPGTSAWEGFGR
jgi:hypothetical protein